MKMTYRLFYIFYLSLKSKKQKICLGDYNLKKKSAERVVLREGPYNNPVSQASNYLVGAGNNFSCSIILSLIRCFNLLAYLRATNQQDLTVEQQKVSKWKVVL